MCACDRIQISISQLVRMKWVANRNAIDRIEICSTREFVMNGIDIVVFGSMNVLCVRLYRIILGFI